MQKSSIFALTFLFFLANIPTSTNTTKTMTNAEIAKTIRQSLKNILGYNAKQVSVTSNWSSVNVKCKVAGLDVDAICKIAKSFRHVDYDQFGDILAGGNTYVFVKTFEGYTR